VHRLAEAAAAIQTLPFELCNFSMETTTSDAEQEQQQAQPPELPTASAADRERFEVELEFVQCLASPEYLHCTSICRHSVWLQCENMHQQYASYFARFWLLIYALCSLISGTFCFSCCIALQFWHSSDTSMIQHS
jgi:SOH1